MFKVNQNYYGTLDVKKMKRSNQKIKNSSQKKRNKSEGGDGSDGSDSTTNEGVIVFSKDVFVELIKPLLSPRDLISLHNTCRFFRLIFHYDFLALKKRVSETRQKFPYDWEDEDDEEGVKDFEENDDGDSEIGLEMLKSVYHNDMYRFGELLFIYDDRKNIPELHLAFKRMLDDRAFVAKVMMKGPEAEPIDMRLIATEFQPYRPFDPDDNEDVENLANGTNDEQWSLIPIDLVGEFDPKCRGIFQLARE